MEIIIKKTYELTDDDKKSIQALFELIFKKHRVWEIHNNQFINNCLGYSWHAILYDGDRIVGISTYVPAYYNVKGKKVLMANCIDCMIDKPYRDFFAYYDLIKASYKALKNDGVAFMTSYPNDNAYPITIKAKLTKNIGKMHTYCLPYRIGGIKKSLTFLNPLSQIGAKIFGAVSSLFASDKEAHFQIEKDTLSYNQTRYKRNDGNYGIVNEIGLWFSYKIQEQDGIQTAFIIDVLPKSSKNFVRAVKWLLKNESKNFDLILYPGYLPFYVTGMFRLPRKFEPKNFHFTGKILDKSAVGDEVFDIRNWDTNLSNYDLL